jgi:hypothetical protein
MNNFEVENETGSSASPQGGWQAPVNTARLSNGSVLRIRLGLITSLMGLLIFLLGAEPGLFGLDRSPVTGFVQIAVFLVGLGIICLGGFISLNTLWNGSPKSIVYDIGLRLVATGYVISVGSGMADVFGFGSQTLPLVPRFGAWQKIGVISGQFVIAVGFLMMIPYPRWMRFLRLKSLQQIKTTSDRLKDIRSTKSSVVH